MATEQRVSIMETVMADQIKQEIHVMQRVRALNSAGLWKKLRPVVLPKDPKCHWEYLLEEAQWMAKVINDDRVLKEKRTKQCAKMIQNYFRAEELKLFKLAKEEEVQKRKIASQTSKIIKQFWANAETLVNYKGAALLDIARRRNLDEKLSEVLTTSEKFSEQISRDLEITPQPPIDSVTENDEDFVAPSDSESDIEDTIAQEETQSRLNEQDYKAEIDELEEDNNLSLEELLAKYSAYQSDTRTKQIPDTPDLSQCSSSPVGVQRRKMPVRSANKTTISRLDGISGSKDNSGSDINSEQKGRYRLRGRAGPKAEDCKINDDFEDNNNSQNAGYITDSEDGDIPIDELLNDEALEKLQPSGHTFESAKVTTKVPRRLLRGELREYQHIGLDWLVTLYERNLNGILADEMGLGKTIQTIALLAYLALEKGNWGPHLIIVPTSLMLNWELEFLRWCPGFKIMTYYGSQKERKLKRRGWCDPNYFHICITSYTIAVQDHLCFRRRPWEYMILDEAHNIKNFKSQRWQVLLNFNTKRRLLLTGTPLQNNLMELWSLLHFLMPNVFESHSEFNQWFSKPISEITSGSREYNDNIVKKFHKTLRPFMLRRLKSEVEKQMPQKIEHVIKCDLSKRQRHLYDEFMARSDTKSSINCGSFLNVLNVLMQLRKVCNHPDLFEARPITSSFRMEEVSPKFPKCVWDAADSNVDMHDLMNTKFCGSRSHYGLNAGKALEFIYESELPVRNTLDNITQEPVLNVFIDSNEIPKTDVSLTLCRMPMPCLYAWKGFLNSSTTENLTISLGIEAIDGEDEEAYPIMSQSTLSPVSQYNSVADSTFDIDTETDDVANELQSHIENDAYIGNADEEECLLQNYFPWTWSLPDVELPEVIERMSNDRRLAVTNLFKLNRRRYQVHPLLDEDSINSCLIIGRLPSRRMGSRRRKFYWKRIAKTSVCTRGFGFRSGTGHAEIMTINAIRKESPNLFTHPFFMWRVTTALCCLVKTIEQRLSSIRLDLVVFIPPVCIKTFPEESIFTPATATIQYRSIKTRDEFKRLLTKPLSILHPIASRMATSFPDPRLVEYDCGKLQVLSGLLRDLKSGGHKVLLFTQMTKMLDILESFLNYQGHIYLRLDGGTKVDQRQLLVERFNKDPKTFCFLLSTRAGGLGINLTGADTVIFYDSDWNPTIDAQAQDRCHRIGQTRNVHIYRLISKNTVEENILKTSNQKKLLGEHAIEDGKFNMEYFRKDSFRQLLFDMPESEQVEKDISVDEKGETISKEGLENALARFEDDVDRNAAVTVLKEVEAERDEFSENNVNKTDLDMEKLKADFLNILAMFNSVERYAFRCLDCSFGEWSDEYLKTVMQTASVEENGTSKLSAESQSGASANTESSSEREKGTSDSSDEEGQESSLSDGETSISKTSEESLFVPIRRTRSRRVEMIRRRAI